MAKGQTVADLKINLKADLGDLEILRKDLKQISKESNFTDKNFEKLIASIKDFGKETKNTTIGIKGQIASFEKLRTRVDFQSEAYKELTREIVSANSALSKNIELSKKSSTQSGDPIRRTPGADFTTGLLASTYFGKGGSREAGTQEEFNRRIAGLQQLIVANRTWESLSSDQQSFLSGIRRTKAGGIDKTQFSNRFSDPSILSLIKRDDERIAAGKESSINRADFIQGGKLNDLQLKALGIRKDLDVSSRDYLDVITKINAEESQHSRILRGQNLESQTKLAVARAQTRASEVEIGFQRKRAASSLYQDYRAGVLDTRRGRKGTSTTFGTTGSGFHADEFRSWPQFAKTFHGFMSSLGIESDVWKGYQQEIANRGLMERRDTFLDSTKIGVPSFDQWFGAKDRSKQIDKRLDKWGRIPRKDEYGLGDTTIYPKSKVGFATHIQDLSSDLENLEIGGKDWVQVAKEIIAVDKEWKKATEAGNKKLETRVKTLKMLPAAGGSSAGKMQKAAFLAGADTGFTADQYGPRVSTAQRIGESQAQFVQRLQESVKAGNLNINTLTKQRAKLEEIRNTLDPTSAAFGRVTQAITKTDKALSRLNNNKFSGANLARTGQAILGAGFFGGPAGFLGAGIGAGVNALRPGGDMQQGAITGGLIASQVVSPVASFISNSATYASDIAKLEIALKKATGEGEKFQVALDTAALVTAKFNVPQEIATRGMTRLAAAVTGAGGTVEHAAIAFHNVTAAIKGTAGSSEDVKSAITAMVQIFSKGRVSAEELSGQLGERFPGAVTKFQEANSDIYKSTADLQDALKKGEVGLRQLWEFVMLLGDDYTETAEKIGASNEEAGARAIVQMNALRIHLGQLLKPIGAQFQVIQAQLLEDLVPVIVTAGEWAVKIGQMVVRTIKFVQDNFNDLRDTILIFAGGLVLGTLMQSISTVIAGGITLTTVIKGIKDAMIALNIASFVNPWVALAAGIIAAAVAMDRFLNANKKLAERAASGDIGAIAAATKLRDEEQAKLDKRKGDLAAYLEKHQFKEGGLAYKDIMAKFNLEVKALEDNIKMLDEAIKSGEIANVESANKFIENLKKGLTDLPNYLSGSGNEKSGYESFWKGLTDGAKHAEEVFTGAFKKMEDSLTEFVMTGKLNFKSFARSIIADMARMIIKAAILGPLFKFIAPAGGTGWFSSKKVAEASSNALGNVYGQNGIVPFARGGIVDSPTLFPFANGAGLMGEAGPEAIIPLKRGRDGKLGVAGGGGTNIAVNVDATGSSAEGDTARSRELGTLIGAAIQTELVKQKRPGGLLA